MPEFGETTARAALLAVFLLPALGAALANLPVGRVAAAAPPLVAAVAWGASLYLAAEVRGKTFEWLLGGWGWRIDALAAGALVVSLGAALALQLYTFALGSRRGSGGGAGAVALLSAGAALVMSGAGGALVLCGLETAALGLLWLHRACGKGPRVRFQWAVQRLGTAAVAIAYIVGPDSAWAAAGLLAGVVALWVQTGLATGLDRRPGTAYGAAVQLVFALPVGAYLLLRWNAPLADPPVSLLALLAGGGLLLAGGFAALRAVDARRLLACLALAQGGYVLLAVGLAAPDAALVHLGGAVCGLLLLGLGAGRVVHALEGRSALEGMGGLAAYLPLTFWVVLVGGLSLAAVPPFAGFWTQGEIFVRAYGLGLPGVFALVCLAVPLVAAGAFRFFCLAFFGPPSAWATRPLVEWPALAALGLVPAAVCCAGASLWSYPLGDGALLRLVAGQWAAGAPVGAGRLSIFELAVVSSGLTAIGLAVSWGRGGAALDPAPARPGAGLFDRAAHACGESVHTAFCRVFAVAEVALLEMAAFVLPASLAAGLARSTEKVLSPPRGYGGWWTGAGVALFLAYMLWRGG